jgi:hypothetical protein
MNPELLRSIYFGMEIVYPPSNTLDKQQLTELYGQINQRYNYVSFALLGNGAQLTEANNSVCRILQDRIQLSEENLQADIQIYKEKAIEIVRVVQEKIHIPIFLMQSITLRALWPCNNNQNAYEVLQDKFLKIQPEEVEKLERPLAGIGLRFNSPTPENVFDFKVEPWFRDMNQIFIELRGEFPQPIQTLDIAEKRVDQVYQYLFHQIRGFIMEQSL